jgi:hypothetical protein
MYITESKTKFKTYKNNDTGFHFSVDNITLVPRAAIEISQRCPENYRSLIQECIGHGWIRLVAHQPMHEHFIEELS